MSYTKTNWQNLPNQTTSITAERLNNIENGIANSDGAIGVNEYSSSSTYSIGDYCLYNNNLYKCKVAISTAEAWTASHWEETNLIDATKGEQTTTSATSHEITDCAGVSGKLYIDSGKTEQAEYTGKNKLPYPYNETTKTYNGVTITDNGDGTLTLNGTSTGTINFYLKTASDTWQLAQGSYKFSTGQVDIGITSVIGGNTDNVPYSYGTGEVTFSVVNGGNFANQVTLQIASGKTFNNTVLKPMIRVSTADNTYEPYVGGISSPNPDYPQDIVSVGSNVNLFDTEILEQGALDGNGLPISSDVHYKRVRTSREVLLNSGTYTISATNLQIVYYRFNADNILYPADQSKQWANSPVTFTLEGNGYIMIALRKSDNSNLSVSEITDIKVEKGTNPTSYSPYNYGSIDFLVRNKNLFDKNTEVSGQLNDNGTITSMSSWFTSDYIKVNPNTMYCLSWESPNSYFQAGVGYFDENKNILQARTSLTRNGYYNNTFTTIANTKYVRVYYSTSVSGTSAPRNNIQLEKGTSRTSYVEHQEQTINVPLPEGMELCKIGSYADKPVKQNGKWYKYAEIDKYVFDGTEVLTEQYSSSTRTGFFYTFNNIKSITTQAEIPKLKCTKFISVSTNETWQSGNMSMVPYSSDNKRVYFFIDANKTLSDIQSILANQPLYYILATPTYTEITDTDTLEGLYQLEHLLMYEGYTLIECTDDIKPDIHIEYLYNNEINNALGSRIDEVEESVDEIVISDIEPTYKRKLWIQHKKNIFKINEAIITNGFFDSQTGEFTSDGGSYVTENYTEVEANKTYIIEPLTRVVYYNSSKQVISVNTTTTYFTTPTNTKYIRTQSNSNTNNIIIQEGTEIVRDGLYVLNENNLYDKLSIETTD